MNEESITINLTGEILVDIDCSSADFFVGITDKNNVVTPFDRFNLNRTFEFPIIRQINDTRFLVAEARVYERSDNCFLFDFKGKQQGQFFVGDGIQDIEILKNNIIVTYFDEGVYGIDGPNNDGLSIFSLNGEVIFGYNQKHNDVTIDDCYCMCKHNANGILFFPYTDFPLIELNLDTWEEKIYDVPKEVEGSSAITSMKGAIIFHSPYHNKRGLFKWSIGDKKVEKIGEYTERLRGLKNGQFLSKGERGFTIATLE